MSQDICNFLLFSGPNSSTRSTEKRLAAAQHFTSVFIGYPSVRMDRTPVHYRSGSKLSRRHLVSSRSRFSGAAPPGSVSASTSFGTSSSVSTPNRLVDNGPALGSPVCGWDSPLSCLVGTDSALSPFSLGDAGGRGLDSQHCEVEWRDEVACRTTEAVKRRASSVDEGIESLSPQILLPPPSPLVPLPGSVPARPRASRQHLLRLLDSAAAACQQQVQVEANGGPASGQTCIQPISPVSIDPTTVRSVETLDSWEELPIDSFELDGMPFDEDDELLSQVVVNKATEAMQPSGRIGCNDSLPLTESRTTSTADPLTPTCSSYSRSLSTSVPTDSISQHRTQHSDRNVVTSASHSFHQCDAVVASESVSKLTSVGGRESSCLRVPSSARSTVSTACSKPGPPLPSQSHSVIAPATTSSVATSRSGNTGSAPLSPTRKIDMNRRRAQALRKLRQKQRMRAAAMSAINAILP